MFDVLGGFWSGLMAASQPENLLYCFAGALVGTLIGVLPGIGPVTAVALLLPITFHLQPLAALIMLAGIYYGAQYGGSTTAILARLPGENSSIVTCLDGFEMARRGRAGPALATAALASLFAGVFATFFIALFAPPLASVALMFGPAEYFSLMVLGLVAVLVLASGSLLSALGMAVLGLFLSTIGMDVNTGTPRMTMGFFELSEGLDFVAVAMGVYAIGDVMSNLETREGRAVIKGGLGRLWITMDDLRQGLPAAFRGTIIGSMLGILPGGGAMISSFASYAVEKKLSRTPEKFGTGAIQGLAGPEAANNAGAQTSFIPLLTLGIPSNAIIALMAGAMLIQGIQPGPQVMHTDPILFWGLIASMLIGNAMLVVINLPLIGVWVSLLKVPYRLFFPAVVIFSCIGAYSLTNSSFPVYILLIFGVLGYAFAKWQCEPAPLLLAFILGPLVEENLRRAMLLSRGDPSIFVTRPISASLLAVALLLLLAVILPGIRKRRDEAFREAQ